MSNLRNGVRGQKCVSVSDWINLLTYPITDSDTFLRRLPTRADISQLRVHHYMLSNDDLDMLHVNEEAKEEAKTLYAAHPGSNRMPDILPNNCVSDRWAILEGAAI